MNISEKLKRANNLLNYGGNATIRVTEDLYALELLAKILQDGPYLPFSSMALRPYALAFMMNELIINNRKNVIEFGSGMSTLLLGRLVRSSGLETKIVSVDENEGWVTLLQSMIRKEGLEGIAQVIHVPLAQRNSPVGKPRWYVEDMLAAKLPPGTRFDMVVVDGPTAYNPEIEFSRYFALPFVKDRLHDKFAVFLDDADRRGEQKVLHKWRQENGLDFNLYAGTLAVAYTGEHYISNPLRYAPEANLG